MFFEVKNNYMKTHENGQVKKTTEVYLVKAESFKEAETKVEDYAHIYGIRDFTIKGIRIVNLSEVILSGGSGYYSIRISFITLDENTGREKVRSVNMLVSADNIEHAKQVINIAMKDSMIDYRIVSIKESKIIDTIGWEDVN